MCVCGFGGLQPPTKFYFSKTFPETASVPVDYKCLFSATSVFCFLAVMDLAVAAASRRVAAPVLEEDFMVLWMQVRFLFSEAEVSMHLS